MKYDIEFDQGFPAFYIFVDDQDADNTYNSENYWTYQFVQSTKSLTGEQVDTIVDAKPCEEMIPKYITDEYTINEMLGVLNPRQKEFMCPDSESYQLFYPSWLSWGVNQEYAYFAVTIKFTGDSSLKDEIESKSEVNLVQVYPFYNPLEYR